MKDRRKILLINALFLRSNNLSSESESFTTALGIDEQLRLSFQCVSGRDFVLILRKGNSRSRTRRKPWKQWPTAVNTHCLAFYRGCSNRHCFYLKGDIYGQSCQFRGLLNFRSNKSRGDCKFEKSSAGRRNVHRFYRCHRKNDKFRKSPV